MMPKIDDVLKRGNVKVLEDPDEIFTFLQERRQRQSACPAIRLTEDAFIVELDGADGIVDKQHVQMPSGVELRRFTANRGIPWRDDYEGRFEHFWTSDERVDGAGDIVRQSWDFSRYEKLSRVLHAHNWSGLPIGRSVLWDVRDRTDGKEYKGPALYQIFLFATSEMNPEAAKILALVKGRFLTETSVGFFPLKILHVEDDKDRAELGLGRWGVVFEHNQLVETSTCAVACNEGAQIAAGFTQMRDDGIIEAKDLDLIRCLVSEDSTKTPKQKGEMDAAICSVFKDLFPDSAATKDDSVEGRLEKLEEESNRLTKEGADLRRVGAELREEIVGIFKNLKEGLVALYEDQDIATRDSDEEEDDDDEDLDDADDPVEESHDEDDDFDDSEEDEDADVDDDSEDDNAEAVGTAYLDELFGS